MLEEEEGFTRADIHIQPPPPRDLTDEDTGDEDDEVTYDNLSGRQLAQPASATIIRLEGREIMDTEDMTEPEQVCFIHHLFFIIVTV